MQEQKRVGHLIWGTKVKSKEHINTVEMMFDMCSEACEINARRYKKMCCSYSDQWRLEEIWNTYYNVSRFHDAYTHHQQSKQLNLCRQIDV